MYRIRARYEKTGRVKYLGHLEMIKVFERAFRRGKIPLKYSEGFNPHPKMSFALPSSVGFSSLGEYIDVEVVDELEIEAFLANVNRLLPEGLRIRNGGYVESKAKSLMSMVDCSEFIVEFTVESEFDDEFMERLDKLLEAGPLNVMKRTKSGKFTERNLNDNILGHELVKVDGKVVTLKVLLSAGSRGNLNPVFLLKGIAEKLGIEIDPHKTDVVRIDIFSEGKGGRLSLENTFAKEEDA